MESTQPTTDFPEPLISLTPLITGRGLKRHEVRTGPPCLLDLPYRRMVSSGRIAIYLALQHRQLGMRKEVLVPAFHCESMVAPVRAIGGTPVFYRIAADTSIDLDDVRAKTTEYTGAIIATHYYGFPQRLQSLQQFCRERDIALIEDCAHAFFGEFDGTLVGACGDYAIGSAMKFFPILDGGLLASRAYDLSDIPLDFPNRKFELKALLNPLERSTNYARSKVLSAVGRTMLGIKDKTWKFLKSNTPGDGFRISTPASSEGGFDIDTSWSQIGMSRVSRSIMLHTDRERIVTRRRHNYELFQQQLGKLRGARPLFRSLHPGAVPLVFPLFVDDPGRVSTALKVARVPIWRFGEFLDPTIDDAQFHESWMLSKHVLQFPCHQEIGEQDIQFMAEHIRRVVDG